MNKTMDQKDLFVKKIQRCLHVSQCVLAAGVVHYVCNKEEFHNSS